MIPQKGVDKSIQGVYPKDETFDSVTPKSEASFDESFLEAFDSKLELGDGLKGHPEACIFVASLANHTTEDTLKTFFSEYGTVIRVNVLRDKADRPYAFVQFQEPSQANNALTSANHANIDGRKIRVERARVNRTLFVAKLNKNFTHKQLREAATRFGDVESVTIIKNHETNKSKGCGFIKYRFREDAVKALMNLRNIYKNWVIEWATSPNDPELLGVDRTSIFVGGLNTSSISKKSLEDKFAVYGIVQLITLIEKKDDPENKGSFAFIKFESVTSATTAIEQENGTEWLGRSIKVQYCESPEMKEKRKIQNVVLSNYPYYDMNMMHYYHQENPYVPYYYYPYAQTNTNGVPSVAPKVSASPYNSNQTQAYPYVYPQQANGSYTSGSESPEPVEAKSDGESSTDGTTPAQANPMLNYYPTNPYMFMNMPHMYQGYPHPAYRYPYGAMYNPNSVPANVNSDSTLLSGALSPVSSSSSNSSTPTSPIVGKSNVQGDKVKKTPEHDEHLRSRSEEANRNQPLL